MSAALEKALADICAANDLHVVDVGINLKQLVQFRFDVTVHWTGFSKTGICCTSACASTLSEALEACLIRAADVRTPFAITVELPSLDVGAAENKDDSKLGEPIE